MKARMEKLGVIKNRHLRLRWSGWTAPHPETGEKEFNICFNDKNHKFILTLSVSDLEEIAVRKISDVVLKLIDDLEAKAIECECDAVGDPVTKGYYNGAKFAFTKAADMTKAMASEIGQRIINGEKLET